MAKRSGWLNIPLMVVRHEWPHSSGATDPESIRSKIIVTWERWPDASLPLSVTVHTPFCPENKGFS